MVHVTGVCEICGEPGKRVQIKPRGGRLAASKLPKDRDWIILCPTHLYEMHGFFRKLTDDGAQERRERREQMRKRLQRTVA